MAYIFDPLRNTFIDDEDTSLGNKLALLDDDLEKAIREIGEKYGSDTIKTLDQLPENKPAEVEDTERFNRFNRMYEDGGRVNQQAGTDIMTLNPLFPEKSTDFMSEEFKPLDVPGGFILPAGISLGAKRLSDIFFNKDKEDQKDLIPSENKTPGSGKPPSKGPDFTETIGLEFLKEAVKNREYSKEGFFENINKYSKEKHGGNLKRAIADLTDTSDNKQLNNVYTQIVNAANRKGFKFDTAGLGLQSNILQSKVPVDLNTLTTTLKTNPGILDNRIKELKGLDLNKVYNKKELADIIGLKRAADTSDKVQVRKDNFLMELLLDQGLEYKDIAGGKVGFTAKETIDALKDYSKNKMLNYESRSYSGNLRKKSTDNYKLRAKVEGNDYMNLQSQINKSFTRTLLNDDLYLPNSVAEFGHNPVPVSLTEKIKMLNNKELSQKIFNIQNQTWQGKEINYDTLMRTSGTLEKTLKGIDKFFNKKITKNNIQELNKLSKELDNYYNSVVEKAGEAVDDLPFHKEVIGKLNLTVPNVGDKLTADNFNVDMSGVDKRFIIGNIDLINPNATRYSDLTLEEKEEFGQNIIDQKILQIQEFYGPKGANFPLEIINDFIEKLEFGTSEVMGMVEREGLGKITKADGGPIELSPMPRAEFGNGGAAGADDNFAAQLEYFFLNPDAELPAAQTFKETMNPVEIVNDMIDPRNFPYYADRLVESGIRIAEFGTRVLPAVGKLASDLIQKPAFKIKPASGQGYVQDYTDIPPSNITGTGIFSEFLNNLVGSEGTKAITEKTGLAKLIKDEEQKMKDERKTAGAKILADQVTLGMELTAPIFPGLKLLKAYAKNKNLPVDKTTREIMDKEIDEVLTKQGINRRDFMKVTGAGATVAIAKLLGLGDDIIKASKVTRAAPIMDNTVEGMPAWFKDAVFAIERKGLLKSRGDIKGIEPDFFELTLDTKLGKKTVLMSKNDTTGEITLDWTTNYYDMDVPVTIMYRPGNKGKQNFLSDPEFPQSVEKYDVEVDAPEFEYKSADVQSIGPDDVNFDSSVNLDIKEEADAVVEALEELGLGLTKKQKKDAADNFKYYNDVQLDETSVGPDTANPVDESDAYTFLDMIKRNTDK